MSKAPSADLFDLIKSLTKSEKRLFKLYTSRHTVGKQNKYVALFDAIDKLEEYDEQILLKRNPTLRNSNLTSLKSYLYDLIFKSLRNSLQTQSAASQLRYLIDQAELLLAKGLYKQALLLLRKMRRVAEKLEALPMLLEILQMELSIIAHQSWSDQYYQHVRQKTKDTIQQLEETLEYQGRFIEMHKLITEEAPVTQPKEFQQFLCTLKEPLSKDTTGLESTFFAKAKFYEMKYRHSFVEHDIVQAIEYGRKFFDLFDAHPAQKSIYYGMYFRITFNHFVFCLCFGEYGHVKECLKRLHDTSDNHRDHTKIYQQYAGFLYKLRCCHFELALDAVPELEQTLLEQTYQLPRQFILRCYLDIAMLFTSIGNFQQALLYTSQILNSPEIDHFPRQLYPVKLLSIICHYELGNDNALESCIRSIYRYLKKHGNMFEDAKLMLQFLKRLSRIVEKDEIILTLQNYHQQLIEQQVNNRGRVAVNPQFHLVAWLESKIEERPFAVVLKEKQRSASQSHYQKEIEEILF